jgi:HK97 family phage major capsid protein
MDMFSIARVIKAVTADTWGRVRGLQEFEASAALAEKYGAPDGRGIRIPDHALRDLTVASAGGGGYLVGSQHLAGYVEALQPQSVALTLGAHVETVPIGRVAIVPRGITGPTTSWLATEATAIPESTPAFGQIGATPKILGAFCEISRHLLLQAANAEDVIRAELRRAAATALDAAVLQGSGASGEPLGIVGTPGVGSFTGAAMTQAHIRSGQTDIAPAIVDRTRLGFVAPSAVAELLATRQRFTGSSTAIWEGSSYDGSVEGLRALATDNCPPETAILGEWSSAWVLEWADGLVIEIDPYTRFTSGLVGIRLLLPIDVAITRPAAFSVAASVS